MSLLIFLFIKTFSLGSDTSPGLRTFRILLEEMASYAKGPFIFIACFGSSVVSFISGTEKESQLMIL